MLTGSTTDVLALEYRSILATVKEFELEEPSLLFKSRMRGTGSLHPEGMDVGWQLTL